MTNSIIKYINDLNVEIDVLKELKAVKKSEEDISNIEKEIYVREEILNKVLINIKKLEKTEYRLYGEILRNGPTKGIDIVSEYNYINNIIPCSKKQLWRIYKNKIKDLLNF